MKKIKILSVITIILVTISMLNLNLSYAEETADYKVNLSNLSTYISKGAETELKTYTQDDIETFLADYNSGSLPEIYVTEFLFDGVGMVQTPDLDDFIEEGAEAEIKILSITAINVNVVGNVEFSGELTGGMIAVDTNEKSGEINLILNGVNLDTDSKKTPAIYVYNKDITYTGCKVTIKTVSGTKNYVEGGKLKKVSLVGSDELSNYTSKYSGDSQTWYTTYTKYYGIYNSEQINNILFAKVQADNEDLKDGDPYYFYKAAGAISSDIDLYFEGTGYLEVISKNKEGIETKGNLTFSGGTGDYVIYAEDDCLNTTTTSSANKSARNTLTIDVNSLLAIVDSGKDADEGDTIDSNGTLIINGGTIIALAHPGQDAGLDSENGTYINGGTVIATGDMYDAISNESKQNFIVLSFQNAQTEGTLITLLNENDEVVMSYETDRSYTNLVYSSSELSNGTYYLYKGGEIEGTKTNGFYTNVTSYTKGTQQGYSSTGTGGGMPGGMNNGGNQPQMLQDGNMPSNGEQVGTPPEMPQNGNTANDGEQGNTPPEMPQDRNMANDSNQEFGMPSGNFQRGNRPDGEDNQSDMQRPDENSQKDGLESTDRQGMMGNSNSSATNKDFVISGISNQFSGIADYTESEEQTRDATDENSESSNKTEDDNSLANTILPNTGIIGISAVLVIIFAILTVYFLKKNKSLKIK